MTTKTKKADARAERYDPTTGRYLNARDDHDALEGGFVKIVSGEFEGRIGSYEQTLTYDPKTGFPATILVRTRDARAELLTVDYADAEPTELPGGPKLATDGD